MKMSLVISTIATVLVVVVALTTATFAWFTTSGVANTSTNFTVAQSGGAVDLFTWNKTLPVPGFNGAPILESEEMELGQYTESYEWDAEFADGAYTPGDNSNAQTAYRPLMPTKILDSSVEDTETGQIGLPNINFVAAEERTGGQIKLTNVSVKPVVARFQLQTGFASTTAKLQLTVSIPASPTQNDVNAGKDVRIVIIGTSETPSTKAQSFMFGTSYQYITNAPTQIIPDPDNSLITPAYSSYEIADANTSETNVVTNVNLSSFTTTTKSIQKTLSFQMTGGVPVDCVMYIWLEGNETEIGSSTGNFTIALNITGTDNNAVGG